MEKFFFKRLVAMLVTLLMVGTTMVMPAMADEAISDRKKQLFETAYSAQVVQNTLYVTADEKLISIVQGQETPTTIFELSDYPELNWYSTLLCSDGTDLYAYDPLTEAIYQIAGVTLKKIINLDVAQKGQELGDESQKLVFEHSFIQDGFFYALGMDFADYSRTIYRFSLENGQGDEVLVKDHEFQEIAAYKNGQLLGLDTNTRNIVTIDAATGKMIDEIEIAGGYGISAMAYDATNDQVYSVLNTQVVRWEKDKPVTVDYVSQGDQSNVLYTGLWDGKYTFINNEGIYSFDTVLATDKVKPLTIWSIEQGLVDSKLISKFIGIYPQTPIVLFDHIEEDALEKVSSVMLTGDDSIDIFAVSSRDIDGRKLFDRGYAYELDSVVLNEDVLSMYPQIQDYLIQNGALLGFPVIVYPDYWTVRPDLLEEAQLGPIPECIEDYYNMMILWYEENYNSRPVVTFNGIPTVQEEWRHAISNLLKQYVYTYATEDKPISFNTPVFRTILEKLASLGKWKIEGALVDHQRGFGERIFSNTYDTKEPFGQRYGTEGWAEQFILPPGFSEATHPIIPASMIYFIVNPHSQNKEGAIKFLEYFSQNMEVKLKYELHPDFNELVERQNYQETVVKPHVETIGQIKNIMAEMEEGDEEFLEWKQVLAQEEGDFEREEKRRWEYSSEVIGQYRKLAPYILFDHGDLVWEISDGLDIEGTLLKYFEYPNHH